MLLWKFDKNGNLLKSPDDYTPDKAVAAGFKPIEWQSQPDASDGWQYIAGWSESERAIMQTWTLTERADDVSDKAAAYDILIGEAE